MKSGDYPINAEDGVAEHGFLHHGHTAMSFAALPFNFSASSINSGTGAVTITLASGVAYITDASGVMKRVVYSGQTFSGVSPGTLPASGKWANYGIEMVAPTVWGGAPAGVSIGFKGTDQNTAALAYANPAAITNGSLRLFDIIIRNNAGVFSIDTILDRRLRTQGASAYSATNGLVLSNGSPASSGKLRIESFSGNTPFLVTADMTGSFVSAGSIGLLSLQVDGSFWGYAGGMYTSNTGLSGMSASAIITPGVGSHVFEAIATLLGSAVATDAAVNLGVRELPGLINNGTF